MRLGIWLAAALTVAGPCSAAQIWFGGEDAVTKQDKNRPGPADWITLFPADAPWREAASRVSVFKISAQMVLRGTDEMLRTAYAGLQRRHIALAVEMGPGIRSAECGGGEGYGPPDLIDRVAGRLQRLGLPLDYWAMDEPIWFAHEKTWGRNDCAYPVDEVARRIAKSVAAMRRYFPAVRIGDIEVLTADRMPPAHLVADYVAFAQAFQRLTGTPLAFFHADVAWRGGGERVLPLFERAMHEAGIRTGVIFGGGLDDGSNEAWVAHGVQRLQAIEADPATRPDDVIVQSWQPLPDHFLPESDPGAATYFLLQAERLAR